MSMNRISPKRKASAKLMFNSTFAAKKPADKATKPKAVRDRGYWKRQADKYFSEFIRLRDSDEFGIATCITSGRRGHWRTMDCGHYLSRAKESTRYAERNCHAQTKQTNRFQGGHFMEHGFRIEEKYGRGTVHALYIKAMQPCKRTLSDYKFVADTYKARVMRIKETEPGRYATKK